jgi:DNA-binding CsgD family transcriptional regulator
MTSVSEMHNRISRIIGNKLVDFCRPLIDHLEISHFYHFCLSNEGYYGSVGLDQGWQDFLHSRDEGYLALPYFYQNIETLKGILFTQTIPNKQWRNLTTEASEDFNIHLGLQINHKFSDRTEGFGFGLRTNDPYQHMILIKELPLLNLFIDEYRKKFHNILIKENCADVAELVGPSYYDKSKELGPSPRELILGKMKIKIENPFSKRETEVARALIKGYSSSQIADHLFISKRTLESHFEKMKDKLDCVSKPELFQEVKKLEAYGFLF